MKLREYTSSDLREIAELFYGTVHTINAADYTAAQLDAWAPKDRNLSEWDDSFKRRFCVVAVEDGKITALNIESVRPSKTVFVFGNIFPEAGLTCEVCGKPVDSDFANRSMAANGGHIYCSGTCKKRAAV